MSMLIFSIAVDVLAFFVLPCLLISLIGDFYLRSE